MLDIDIKLDVAQKAAFIYRHVVDLKGKTLIIFEGMQGTRKSSILKICLDLFNVPNKLKVDFREHNDISIKFQNNLTLIALSNAAEKQNVVIMERSIATHIMLHEFSIDEDELLVESSNFVMNEWSKIFDNIILCDFFTTSDPNHLYDEYLAIKNKRLAENDFIEKDESIKIWRDLHSFKMTDKDIFEQIRLGYVKFFSTNAWKNSTKLRRLNMYQ